MSHELELAASFARLSKHTLAMAFALEAVTAIHVDAGGVCDVCGDSRGPKVWPCDTYVAAMSWAKP